jgi:hypothetical protein
MLYVLTLDLSHEDVQELVQYWTKDGAIGDGLIKVVDQVCRAIVDNDLQPLPESPDQA